MALLIYTSLYLYFAVHFRNMYGQEGKNRVVIRFEKELLLQIGVLIF